MSDGKINNFLHILTNKIHNLQLKNTFSFNKRLIPAKEIQSIPKNRITKFSVHTKAA